VRRSSGGWTFTEVEWCEVEPSPGQRDWSQLDAVVRESFDVGQEPMIKLRTGQCWGTLPPEAGVLDQTEATAKTPSTPPSDVDAYLAFVTDLVRRYAAMGVHQYAVENEVDVVNFWAADPAAYDDLVRAVAPAVREADPQARVLDAGVSSTSYGVALAADLLASGDEAGALETYQHYYDRRLAAGLSRWPPVSSAAGLRGLLDEAAARRSIDSVEVAVGLATDGVVDAYQLHFYENVELLPRLLDFVSDRIGSVPIEAWEIGVAWPGAGFDEQAQADELLRMVALLLADDVRRIVYLPVAFTPGDREQVFRGLIHQDGTPMLAAHTWVTLVDALAGLGDGALTPLSGDLTGVVWHHGKRDAGIVWATSEPTALPGQGIAEVLDVAGRESDRDQPVGSAPVLVVGSVGEDLASRLADGG
jgi:hypothetical protein